MAHTEKRKMETRGEYRQEDTERGELEENGKVETGEERGQVEGEGTSEKKIDKASDRKNERGG